MMRLPRERAHFAASRACRPYIIRQAEPYFVGHISRYLVLTHIDAERGAAKIADQSKVFLRRCEDGPPFLITRHFGAKIFSGALKMMAGRRAQPRPVTTWPLHRASRLMSGVLWLISLYADIIYFDNIWFTFHTQILRTAPAFSSRHYFYFSSASVTAFQDSEQR